MPDTSTHFRGIYVSPTATLLHKRTNWQCGHRYFDGDPRCRSCDSVERINDLAESEAEYWIKEMPLGADRHWGAHWIYAECADIIMEADDA